MADRARYLRAEGDELEVMIVPEGLPQFTADCPAPMIGEEERAERHEAARRGVTLDGYHIVSQRLVRNIAFDRPGERTTLELVYRPCRSQEEAQAVLEKAALYLRRAAKELGYETPEPALEPRRPSPLGDG